MTKHINIFLICTIATVILLTACVPAQPAPTISPSQMPTMAAATTTDIPTQVPPTATPQPTSTRTPIPPTLAPTGITPTLTLVISPIATLKPEFACDIWGQQPHDDKEFRSGADFDIKWTIVNTGTKTWPNNTILFYYEGPRLTTEKKVTLPRLQPGEQTVVSFDASAIGGAGRQVMVWAVTAPGEKDGTIWMCYPYTRIIVK